MFTYMYVYHDCVFVNFVALTTYQFVHLFTILPACGENLGDFTF